MNYIISFGTLLNVVYFCMFITRESSSCFQCVLAIAILSVYLSITWVDHRVPTPPGIMESPGIFFLDFPGPGKSWNMKILVPIQILFKLLLFKF